MSRISELRWRAWPDEADAAVSELTEALRAPLGEQSLRPIQALGIRECLQLGGVFLAARVGAGKTLWAGLLATLYEDIRPLILVPGGHKAKTELEFAAYRKHWRLSHTIQVLTYNDLARDVDEQVLRTREPGILICDEVDKLRRVSKGGSGTAARVAEWMAARPATRFAGASGTMFKEGLLDYGHVLNWALKDKAPVPSLQSEIAQWHRGLKGEHTAWPRMRAQLGLSPDDNVKKGFRERLWHSPGVLISIDCFTGVPLNIQTCAFDPGTKDALQTLYDTGETPDGFLTAEDGSDDSEAATGTWAQERRIALGFYHKPDPTPPRDWAKKRRAYFSWVREHIVGGAFKTELQARRWAIRNALPQWLAWEEIQPTFEPRFAPVWLNDRAIEYCKHWGRDGGIIWTDHRAFAERLSSETGWNWFSSGGLDRQGRMIEKCTDRTVIVSRQACGTGRNLQHWCRGLVTACPGNGRDAEQLFGRQHREGQTRAVSMEILFACRAHANDLRKLVELSEQEKDEMGRTNKILTAGWR